METNEKNEIDNNNNVNNYNILSQRDKSGELEIISEEKNINGSEENTNNKKNKKSDNNTSNKTNSYKKNKLNYSPKFLFENDDNLISDEKNENDVFDLMNYLSDDNEKNKNVLNEEMPIKSNVNINDINNINININKNKLSKSYNDMKEIKLNKEIIDNNINNNNKIELPHSTRLNSSMKLKDDKDKNKNKELSSKKGALKILELLTSKKKEKEEIEKKKEELIETFNKARNDNDKILIQHLEENKENIQPNINEQKNKDDNLKEKEIKEIKEVNNEINFEEENIKNNNNENIKENNINIKENKEINIKIDSELEQKEKEKEKEEKNSQKENKENNNNNISISSNKSSKETSNINNNPINEEHITKKIPVQNNSKLYVKNSRKFIKKPINDLTSKNLTKNSFSISRETPKIKEELSDQTKIINQKENNPNKNSNEKKETLKPYKSFKNNNNYNYITSNANNKNKNKNKKNINKKPQAPSEFKERKNIIDNFDTVTIYKKRQMSKSPKGKIYAPKKALNPRGTSLNKLNENSILSKSNININNVNYINNINTIIKNRNDIDNDKENYNINRDEDNLVKLNNSLNMHYNMNNNNYNNFVIDNYTKYNKNDFNYNFIRNYNSNFVNNQSYKKGLIGSKVNNNLNIRHKMINNNEEKEYNEYSSQNININYNNKNNFKNNSNKGFLLNRYTPDKNFSIKETSYKTGLNSNPQRLLKKPKNIPSIYQNKYNQNNNLSQRYYIYNNNNSNEYINNYNEIISTETNNNTNRNISISINIEDLMIFEEKFSEILYFIKNGKEARNQCFDFWNYFYNCSLFERIEKIFKTENNIEIAKLSINLNLISVMICYEFSYDFNILNKSNHLLLEILELCHRNIMIICENILAKIIPENQKNIWVLKLNNLVQKSKNYSSNNYPNISHIELIQINSSELSQKLQNIFSLFETEYSPLIYTLFKKINQKTYSEINDFYLEYILKIENKESSILAPVLLSSNPNFISFRPPYIHTERIKPYTLILDLNDTIVNFQQTNNSQGILRLRPFLIEFLDEISIYYELILFTTSTEYFSKPIINAIEENKKYFDFVFYREYAIIVGNDFVKDLTRIGRALDSTIIVDNMPQNFRLQKENGIHIKPFFAQDPNDNTLIELMVILIEIAKSGIDVREGLAKYRNDIVQKVTSNISEYNI